MPRAALLLVALIAGAVVAILQVQEPLPLAAPPIAKPSPPQERGRRVVIERDFSHQCYVEVEAAINTGGRFRMLVDTGAWIVTFGPEHYRQLGGNPAALQFNRAITTANGAGRAADIRLRELRINDFVLRDVPAQVTENGVGSSPLLGASVLKLLRFEYTSDACVLILPRTAAALPATTPGDLEEAESLAFKRGFCTAARSVEWCRKYRKGGAP
jgi:clan AA aspartic protease (TIGR02281 family)